jgi:hypothetical protein
MDLNGFLLSTPSLPSTSPTPVNEFGLSDRLLPPVQNFDSLSLTLQDDKRSSQESGWQKKLERSMDQVSKLQDMVIDLMNDKKNLLDENNILKERLRVCWPDPNSRYVNITNY